ncbi:MAG: PP2C family protein-serine/threonine phosphatase [Ignavibacteria bacterium]
MEQRKLYRTLENALKEATHIKTEPELLKFILKEVINNENIDITGGRLWQLTENKTSYRMAEQLGEIEKINKGYTLTLEEYPIFFEVGKNRTIIAKETDKYLSDLGIQLYSATGVGERYKIKDKSGKERTVYQYILALNSTQINESLANTLNIISTAISSIMRSRKIESTARAFEKDLVKAREIQRSILPEHEYVFGNYEIFGISVADKIVGGDFFDYLKFGGDTERLGIAIGDAASKGFSAAAQALYVSGALKMGTENELKMTTVVKKINNLVNTVFPNERFVTLFYLEIYSDEKGLCMYVNAGHNSPFHLIYDSDTIEALDSTGGVLGVSPDQEYKIDSFYFKKYDTLVLYTDGLVEATNNKFEFFGEERLKQEILNNKHFPARDIAANILQAVQTFSSRAKYSDDKTIVVVKRIK